MNVYLDIDGVLLVNDRHTAPFADEFLQYVIEKYPESTYWLSTHCWKGENRCIDILKPHLKDETVKLLQKVKPTDWKEMKTEAIDFETNFRWLDDDLWPEELQALEENNASGNFIMIDLKNDPEMLKSLINVL